jgi:transposase
VGARTLGRERPEVGPRSRQRLAALGGVAPCQRDRGPLRGRRTSWGGRAAGRAVRSRSPLVAVKHHPVRKAFYVR